jgi:hypothetical protein
MTADQEPLPGETLAGRHRPARLWPLGLSAHHVIARAGYAHRSVAHIHRGES